MGPLVSCSAGVVVMVIMMMTIVIVIAVYVCMVWSPAVTMCPMQRTIMLAVQIMTMTIAMAMAAVVQATVLKRVV